VGATCKMRTVAAIVLVAACLIARADGDRARADPGTNGGMGRATDAFDRIVGANIAAMTAAGRQTFRFDTFGDEAFWGDQLQLHTAIEGSKLGGVGAGISPRQALALGLKVDVDALSGDVLGALKSGKANLDDPATTLALLNANAVIGLTGFFNANGTLKSIGIQCALCHSTVDNSLAFGIGHRFDGWANHDLDVGKIIASAPNLEPFVTLLSVTQPGITANDVRSVLRTWGPGKFDAELILDGKGFRPDGKSAATLIPPAFGLAGVNLHTWTGWGSIPYWNAFVAVLEMHGQGNFTDARLDNAAKFPVAARNKMGHTRVHGVPDQVRAKLPALQAYQLSLAAPHPAKGTFDAAAARRGKALFDGKATCASCHMPPTFSDPGQNMHTPASICTDDFQAQRSPDGMYRTTPLGGLGTRTKGGYYHDGRFATLGQVVQHYNSCFGLGLTTGEQSDVTEYLKSL